MTSTDLPPRLAVVAAIIDDQRAAAGDGSPALGSLASAARLGGGLVSKAKAASAADPTATERALAEALQAEGHASGPSDHAIAELLLLADDVPTAGDLAAGLSRAFLLPGDSRSSLASQERRSAFADLYRKLALHQLNSQVRNKAAAVLFKLIRRHDGWPGRRGPSAS